LEEPERNEANGTPEDPVEGSADGVAEDTAEVEVREKTSDPEELKARLGIKNSHIRELLEQITASRLAADEARAAKEANEGHIAALERDQTRLKARIRDLEEEARGRRLRREGLERQVARLQRELERKDGEIARRDYLLDLRAEEIEVLNSESEELVTRKEGALEDALRRIDGFERDLEERENKIVELRATIEELRGELEEEYELRERLAEPANRLRAGIDLFNDSEQRRSVNSLSRTLGQPEVHVDLEEGQEPPVLLTFTWQGVTRQTYAANPGLAVEEPRVYLKSAGENLSGVEREPSNARVGAGGRVLLGL
jgi:ribonucrease Y